MKKKIWPSIICTQFKLFTAMVITLFTAMVITSKGIAIILVPFFFGANNHATLLAIDHASLVSYVSSTPKCGRQCMNPSPEILDD